MLPLHFHSVYLPPAVPAGPHDCVNRTFVVSRGRSGDTVCKRNITSGGIRTSADVIRTFGAEYHAYSSFLADSKGFIPLFSSFRPLPADSKYRHVGLPSEKLYNLLNNTTRIGFLILSTKIPPCSRPRCGTVFYQKAAWSMLLLLIMLGILKLR